MVLHWNLFVSTITDHLLIHDTHFCYSSKQRIKNSSGGRRLEWELPLGFMSIYKQKTLAMYLGDLLPCFTLTDQASSLTTKTFIFPLQVPVRLPFHSHRCSKRQTLPHPVSASNFIAFGGFGMWIWKGWDFFPFSQVAHPCLFSTLSQSKLQHLCKQ